MARLMAMEAGSLGHQLHTFCLGEGVQSPLCLFFCHISTIMGQSFRDVSTIAHLTSVHIHGDDLVMLVATWASWGVLGVEYWGVHSSLGRRLIVVEPQLLGPLLLQGTRLCSRVFLVEPSVLELLVDCLALPGFLLPGSQCGRCGCNMCQDFPDE